MVGSLNASFTARAVLISAALVGTPLGVNTMGCANNGAGPTPSEPESEILASVVTHLADDVIGPDLVLAQTRATTLVERLTAYDDALGSGGDTSAVVQRKTEAQEAWKELATTWEAVELAQIGALAMVDLVEAGESIRDEIYSYPLRNPCGVDQKTASRAYADDNFFAANTVNLYGLDALEHLLFTPSTANVCPNPAAINADGSWAALSSLEIEQRRAAFALVAGRGVRDNIDLVVQKWNAGFRNAFVDGDGSGFESRRDSLNGVFAAFFYLDLVTKDRKLAIPTGLNPLCNDVICPEDVEFPVAKFSAKAIEANLLAAQSLYFGRGDDAPSFDDLVSELNRADLNDAMRVAIDDALVSVRSLDESLQATLSSRSTDVVTIHDKVKAVTDLVKTDLVTVLSLEVPQELDGDND